MQRSFLDAILSGIGPDSVTERVKRGHPLAHRPKGGRGGDAAADEPGEPPAGDFALTISLIFSILRPPPPPEAPKGLRRCTAFATFAAFIRAGSKESPLSDPRFLGVDGAEARDGGKGGECGRGQPTMCGCSIDAKQSTILQPCISRPPCYLNGGPSSRTALVGQLIEALCGTSYRNCLSQLDIFSSRTLGLCGIGQIYAARLSP